MELKLAAGCSCHLFVDRAGFESRLLRSKVMHMAASLSSVRVSGTGACTIDGPYFSTRGSCSIFGVSDAFLLCLPCILQLGIRRIPALIACEDSAACFTHLKFNLPWTSQRSVLIKEAAFN